LPDTYAKEKNERITVKKWTAKANRVNKKQQADKAGVSPARQLSEKLRDIEPAKPRTYYKGAGDVVGG